MTQDQINTLNVLSALPLQSLLLAGMIVEAIVIRTLWSQMQVVQSRLDDCLGKAK